MKLKRSYLFVAAIAAGALVGGLLGGRALASGDRLDERIKKLAQIIQTVQDKYVDEVPNETLIYDGIRGMLRTLDPHTNFLDADSYKDMQDEQRGNFYGLGIVISKRSKDEPLTVISPIDGTPAARLGIRAGDAIVHIADAARSIDVDTTDLSIQDAVKYLKGPKGSEVVITVQRAGISEPLVFKILRDKIDTPSVTNAYMIRPGTGYIKLSNFTQTSADDLDAAIANLKTRGMERLVFDLRGNPGGLLDQAVKVADRFLPESAKVVYTRGRVPGSDQDFYATKKGDENDMPLVVLINRGSASASEIVSGALQDHDRALIVGETSFGKGLVQSVYRLSNQNGLALTTAKYYTPCGRLIQRDYSSLEDYFFDFDEDASGDTAAATRNANREVRHTDTGRIVYGGGGITPDVEVKAEEMPKLILDLTRNNMFFKFAVRFAPTVEDLPKEHTTDTEKLDLLLHTYNPDDRAIDAFRQFLQEKKFSYDESEFRKEEDRIRTMLKSDILETIGGLTLKDRVLIEADAQVLKAIESMPKARDLARLSRSPAPEQAVR
jgi:carboxyl-terminal processing protease